MFLNFNRSSILYLLIYLSLAFVAVRLYQANYLSIPQIYCLGGLLASFAFLFIGMVANAFTWRAALAQNNLTISYRHALVSVGLCIFTKYIPGKILMILGRAEYVSQKYQRPLKFTSAVSLQAQILSLWVGILLGCAGLSLFVDIVSNQWFALSFLLFVALSAFVFLPIVKIVTERTYTITTKKKITIPHLRARSVLASLPWFFTNWLAWCVAFYLLTISLSPLQFSIPIGSGLSFALAGAVGILAIMAPGGIGVREAVLTYCLTLAGLELVEATTIAVASRLWFLIGEGFLFAVALLLNVKAIDAPTD